MQNSPTSPVTPPALARVAAVVVTRNRLPLLKRCLESLSSQTRALDAIYVVDVASTDETPAFLSSNAAQFQTVRLETNAGGAGGFHAGIERTFADGFDWIWLMDDDGYAAPDALEKLLSVSGDARNARDGEIEPQHRKARWLNSLVVRIEDPSLLAFAFPLDPPDVWKHTAAEMRDLGLCVRDCCPFNGTLIHRALVEEIGSPHPDLFIWGDEQEYRNRALGAGFGIFTVTDSLFYHPASNSSNASAVPIHSFWKQFYHVRNHGACATKDGQLKLSAGASFALGRVYIRTLLVGIVLNSFKILIILAAILAAVTNNTKRYYPK